MATRPRGTLLALTLLLLGAGSWLAWHQWHIQQQSKGRLKPSGGRYFFRPVELDVPPFRQADQRWRTNTFGAANDTLGSAGCAIASAAMVMTFYGFDTDPGRLNAILQTNGGFVGPGWLVWEKAAEFTGGAVEKMYEDDPSYGLMDDQLEQGNPVIVRLRPPDMGTTHFVVVMGKRGFDYLIRDPGRGAGRGVYPLKDLGSDIEALRFYRRVPRPPAR